MLDHNKVNIAQKELKKERDEKKNLYKQKLCNLKSVMYSNVMSSLFTTNLIEHVSQSASGTDSRQ